MFIAAAAVLSGIICGINETSLTLKAAAVMSAAAAVCVESGVLKNDTSLFRYISPGGGRERRKAAYREETADSGEAAYSEEAADRKYMGYAAAVAALLLFAVGAVRGAYVSSRYSTPESRSFYERYEPTNPGQFDYAVYLKANGISSTEEYESFRAKEPGQEQAPLIRAAAAVRKYAGDLLEESTDSHDAGIYKAVLLGEKQEMDSDIRSLYQSAGIAHLLSVSGLHVGMIGSFVYGLLRRKQSGRRASAAASLFLLFYMLIAGSSGSVIRAVIMLIISFSASNEGRTYDLRSSVCAAAIVIMLRRPYMIFTSGFQLSFGAVAAITIGGNEVLGRLGLMRENRGSEAMRCKRVRKQNRPGRILSLLVISAAIQLVTLPVTAYHFFVFPIYGILLNLIVIPLMGCVLCSGFGVTAAAAAGRLLSWIIISAGENASRLLFTLYSPDGITESILSMSKMLSAAAVKATGVLGIAAAAPGHYILKLYEGLCSASLRLPFAAVTMGRPGIIQIIAYYMVLAGGIVVVLRRGIRRKRELWIRYILMVLVSISASFLLLTPPAKGCRVTVMDVGQGDCSLICFEDKSVLLDGGSSDNREAGQRIIEPCIKSKGIDRLDMVIVSHCDNDHINGLYHILSPDSGIKVGCLMLPSPAKDNEAYRELMETARKNGIPTGFLAEGEILKSSVSEGQIYCLYSGAVSGDTNRHSPGLLVSCGDFSMLFTGDMGQEDEALMCGRIEEAPGRMKEAAVNSDVHRVPGGFTVFKAGHHGSRGSNSERLLKAVSPEAAVISCGRKNRYSHPHEEVLSRFEKYGTEYFSTASVGAVEIDENHIYGVKR